MDPDIRQGANLTRFPVSQFFSSLEGAKSIAKLDGGMAGFSSGSDTADGMLETLKLVKKITQMTV